MEWKLLNNEQQDWILYLSVFIFALIAFLRVNFKSQFNEFLKLFSSSKYIFVFNKRDKYSGFFTGILLVVQWLSLSLSFCILLNSSEIYATLKSNYAFFNSLFVFLVSGSYFLLKLLLQFILIQVFNVHNMSLDYIFTKLSFTSYGGVLLFVLNFLCVYMFNTSVYFLYFSLFVYIYFLIKGLFFYIGENNKEIFGYWFYFFIYFYSFEVFPPIALFYLLSNVLYV